jgi:hypothetical protein
MLKKTRIIKRKLLKSAPIFFICYGKTSHNCRGQNKGNNQDSITRKRWYEVLS